MKLIRFLQELVVGHHAIFHKKPKTFPLLLEFRSFFIKYFFELIRYFFRDMVVYFFNVGIALQIAPAHIQWYVRAINYAMQKHLKFWNDILNLVCTNYL